MKSEQAYFIQILEDYIHQRPSEFPCEEINWLQIAKDAKDQSLGGIIYVQCKDFLPEGSDARQLLHQDFQSAVYTSVNGRAALRKIAVEFEKASISYLPFKGELIREYYPNPELRTMGDIDVLIQTQDRESADAIMHRLGYRKFVDNHAVWTYLKPNLMFEIHDVMFYEHLSNSVNYRDYFNRIWETAIPAEGKNGYVPEPNRHFVYLICHMAKHIINKGIGFRAFLDVVFMSQKEQQLNWDWIAAELARLELLNFAKTCFALCERWFHVPMPFSAAGLEETFFEGTTAKMFRDGTFGLQNEQNEAAYFAKEIRRSDQSYWRTAIALTWQKLFPSYEDMQLIPWYRFVDGRPWLMPAAWVYRWIYTATHKFKDSRELFMKPFVKRKLIEKREKLIDDWKL